MHVTRSMKNFNDVATIAIPHIGKIKSKSHSFPERVSLRTLINDRDPVTILLGYNGNLKEEFRGFVKRRGRGMPMVIECEGYIQQLRLDVSINKYYKNTTAKQLLLETCEGTDISVICPVDFPLSGARMVHADGVRILEWIKEASGGALTIFFIKPDVLWCGLTYTAYAADSTANVYNLPTVNYRLGWNCVKDNGLKERVQSEPVQVILNGKLATGNVVMTKSKNEAAVRKLKWLLNHVPDEVTMGKFAQENEWRMNYTGAEGYVNGFLVPYALPGYDAYVSDTDDKDLNGVYLVEQTDVTFGVKGAKRKVKIGPLVGFDK